MIAAKKSAVSLVNQFFNIIEHEQEKSGNATLSQVWLKGYNEALTWVLEDILLD